MFEITSIEDIELLKESEELECKAAAGRDGLGALPNDFWSTYSAMANTDGGVVLLGIKETKAGFKLQGLKKVEHIKKCLVDTANNQQKVSINLLDNSAIKEINIDNNLVLQITIPRATRKQRPVYLNQKPFDNTYRRLHEADQLLDGDTVKRYLAEQIHDSLDDQVLEHFGLSDINLETLRSYRQIFANRQPDHPWNSLGELDFLKKIGAWRLDRETGAQGLTLAGLLMFGTHPIIQEKLPLYMLDYQERDEAKAEKRWIDRVTLDGTWSGNLFDFYKKVFKKLTDDIKVPFETTLGERKDETTQHEAIREALCNVLVHADYSGRASILVVKRPDMFGFRNPGLMRIPPEFAMQGGEPDCRNRLLHQMFRYVGIGDQSGSGLPKILKTWKENHWRTPLLYDKTEPYDQTLLEMRMLDLFPNNIMEGLRFLLGTTFEEIGYLGQIALAIAATEGTVTHDRLKNNTDCHPTDLSKKLHELIELGILEKTGMNKGAVYHIVGLKLPSPEDVFGNSPILENNSPILENNSLNSESSSPILASEDKSRDNDGCLIPDQNHFDLPFIDDLDKLSIDLKSRLEILATEPRTKKTLSKVVMKQVIENICENHFVTISALANLLNRKTETLRGNYLSPMIKEGTLKLAFPKTPNHPKQAYTKA
ncbi:MAG: putative DNA binding domain-containing protein [Pseudomonadota bacterium]|nr:putative DNA binding domain-containing protein [Pseudomonadota bacterium]